MRVLVSVQSPEPVASAGTFPDLCPFASSPDPHLPHSLSRSLVSRASSWSLRCSTSSVNQQISSELRPHLSFFPPSIQCLSFLTVSIILPSSSLPLPPSLPPSAGFGLQAGSPRTCLHFAGTRARPPAYVHGCKTLQPARLVH